MFVCKNTLNNANGLNQLCQHAVRRSGNVDQLKTPPAKRAILDNAVRAVDHLVVTGHVPRHAPLVLFGNSLGGAVATYVARHRPRLVHGLLLLSPFGSVVHVVGTRIPRIAFKWATARGVDCPATVVHGSNDVIVPLHLGRNFAAHFTAAPDFVVVTHGTHNNVITTHTPDTSLGCMRLCRRSSSYVVLFFFLFLFLFVL